MTRLLRHVLIALVLLFSQQAALLHGMGHVMGSATGNAVGQSDDGFAGGGHVCRCGAGRIRRYAH